MSSKAQPNWLQAVRNAIRAGVLVLAAFILGLGAGFFLTSKNPDDSDAAVASPVLRPPAQLSWSLSVMPSGPSPVPPAATIRYLVQAGDSLTSLATRFGTTPNAIASMNNMGVQAQLVAGQNILVPAPGR